ncbi:MAG: M48 family metallopeptidase, partial [Candidatus Adiutrix sp.]
MKSKILLILSVLLFVIFTSACASVPGTGRSQLSLVKSSELNAMANTQYSQIIKKGPLSTNRQDTAMIKNVGAKISKAAEEYLREHGLAADIPNYNWEFNLIESEAVNAFCMPGGKVVFYTGILAYTKHEAGVAAVMGHEVAHAIAQHSRERASQQMMTNVGATILNIGLGVGGTNPLTAEMAMAAYGAGSQVGILLP